MLTELNGDMPIVDSSAKWGGLLAMAQRALTAHPLAAALCTLFAGPLVSTSANPQGLPAATNGLKVKSYFGQSIDYLAPGAVGSSRQASEIRNLITSEVIRPG